MFSARQGGIPQGRETFIYMQGTLSFRLKAGKIKRTFKIYNLEEEKLEISPGLKNMTDVLMKIPHNS